MRTSVPPCTQIDPKPTAIPERAYVEGDSPTAVFVEGSIRERSPTTPQPAQLVSHTEPSPIATPTGNVCDEMVASTRLLSGSICVRSPPATHTPAPMSAAMPFNGDTLR